MLFLAVSEFYLDFKEIKIGNASCNEQFCSRQLYRWWDTSYGISYHSELLKFHVDKNHSGWKNYTNIYVQEKY